ncbi:MAG: DUF86 domain-containing protein [bacterium]
MEIELSDLSNFFDLDYKTYQEDRNKRRSLERCIENIVNASLDIAKIILVSENKEIPDTYKEYFLNLSTMGLISNNLSQNLAEGTKLRYILAHQYLDIRWDSIKKFLSNKGKEYQEWLKITKQLVTTTLKEENQG